MIGCNPGKGDTDEDLYAARSEHMFGSCCQLGAQFGHQPSRSFDEYQSYVTGLEFEVARRNCSHRRRAVR